MIAAVEQAKPAVKVERHPHHVALILNRHHDLNALNREMVRLLRLAWTRALAEESCRLVVLQGAGDRGFCAGGDLKALARAVREDNRRDAAEFFLEEYALDLFIHRFPKPVVTLADGVTMGGGLGLAAASDFVVATERTRMAMPESRIGFFPDVGATGWLFHQCPPGYPEYLALTGYDMAGGECVRLGLATHLVRSARLSGLRQALEEFAAKPFPNREEAREELRSLIASLAATPPPPRPEMDAWVAEHFAGKSSLQEIMASLRQCSVQHHLCQDVFQSISERSPTALVLTLKLLRHNEGRPLQEVFAAEYDAARFMIHHPDYLEGIRARLLDRDDHPRWQPATIEEVGPLEVNLGGGG
jgi:enoyl-CoA hydratase